SSRDLTTKVPPEFHAIAGDERAGPRDVEAEPRTQVAALPEPDVGVRMAQQHPPLPKRGHQQRSALVPDRHRKSPQACTDSSREQTDQTAGEPTLPRHAITRAKKRMAL